jgi:hypothetical protein
MKRSSSLVLLLAVLGSVPAGAVTFNDPSALYYRIDVGWPALPVSVTNWPAVQTVTGTVNVGNMPAPKPQPIVLELLTAPAPITESEGFISGAVDTRGYSMVGVHVLYWPESYYLTCATTEWRWSADDDFAPSSDSRDGPGAIVPGSRTIFHTRGPWMRVKVPAGCTDGWSVRSIRVYLFNEN